MQTAASARTGNVALFLRMVLDLPTVAKPATAITGQANRARRLWARTMAVNRAIGGQPRRCNVRERPGVDINL